MDDDGALTGVLPKLEVLAPARLGPRPSQKDQLSQTLPLGASGAGGTGESPDSTSLDFNRSQQELTWDENRTLGAALMALPSWLVSFIVHLVLLLVLATCTYVAQHDGPIFLELSEVSRESEPSLMEVTIEDPTLEDPFGSLESDEALVAESELPEIELEEQAALPELYETSDPFELAGLPEFSTKQAVAAKPAPKKEGGDGTEFFGTRSYGSEFVFVIDCSSSMSAHYRWDRAVNELITALDQFDEKQKFLVLLYNDRSYMMFGAPNDQKLIPATPENKRRISEWLRAATPFAGTRPSKSIRLALRKKPDAIYFLSDGELRDNTMFGLRSWNVPRKGPDGIKRLTPIHTILIGSNFGRETMRVIAEENNGIFTQVR